MNLFVTNGHPETAALWLDDVRRVAQINEAAQMMSTAVHLMTPEHEHRGELYQTTHPNHPVTVWVREAPMNFFWTLEFFRKCVHFHGECKSTGELHKAWGMYPILRDWIEDVQHSGAFPHGGFTGFYNQAGDKASGLDFQHVVPTTKAYRMYMCAKWNSDQKAPTWEHGRRPEWYEEKRTSLNFKDFLKGLVS